MNKGKIIKIVICVLIIGGAITIGLVNYFGNKTRFNSDSVNGNSGGNLYNGGYFCEYDDMIYFSNPNDNGKLYSMDRNGNNITKICDDTASSINVDENYIYYTRSNEDSGTDFSFLSVQAYSLCRIKKNGSQLTVLDPDPCLYASLVGNYIYYVHYDEETASTLYRVKIDGTEKECVLKNDTIAVSANGSNLYYSGTADNHHVYRINAETGATSEVISHNCYQPTIADGYMYYLDCDNNYRLTRQNLSSGEVQQLTTDRVDCYNVYGSFVYFQRNDSNNPALCRVKITDGATEVEEIATGNHCNINVTSTNVYFMKYGDDATIFTTPTNGRINVTVFSPDVETED